MNDKGGGMREENWRGYRTYVKCPLCIQSGQSGQSNYEYSSSNIIPSTKHESFGEYSTNYYKNELELKKYRIKELTEKVEVLNRENANLLFRLEELSQVKLSSSKQTEILELENSLNKKRYNEREGELLEVISNLKQELSKYKNKDLYNSYSPLRISKNNYNSNNSNSNNNHHESSFPKFDDNNTFKLNNLTKENENLKFLNKNYVSTLESIMVLLNKLKDHNNLNDNKYNIPHFDINYLNNNPNDFKIRIIELENSLLAKLKSNKRNFIQDQYSSNNYYPNEEKRRKREDDLKDLNNISLTNLGSPLNNNNNYSNSNGKIKENGKYNYYPHHNPPESKAHKKSESLNSFKINEPSNDLINSRIDQLYSENQEMKRQIEEMKKRKNKEIPKSNNNLEESIKMISQKLKSVEKEIEKERKRSRDRNNSSLNKSLNKSMNKSSQFSYEKDNDKNYKHYRTSSNTSKSFTRSPNLHIRTQCFKHC